jgi:hypothetical protein
MITYKPLPIADTGVAESLSVHNVFTQADTQLFIDTFDTWLRSSRLNTLVGLNEYSKGITDGVTGAFVDFEHAYSHLRTTVFKGEYPYHRDIGIRVITKVGELTPGDKLILSVPFSATGNKPEEYDTIMMHCIENDIPVFIDMAYYGSCKLGTVDLSHSCIKFVGFSLSKTFGTGKCRIGMLYYRDVPTGPTVLLNQYNYVNHVSINIHMPLLEKFAVDYMWNRYNQKQMEIAQELGVEPSSTVFLCITNKSEYNGFSRAGLINRIGIGAILPQENIAYETLVWVTKP